MEWEKGIDEIKIQVTKDIKKLINDEAKKLSYRSVSYDDVLTVLDNLGFSESEELSTNGWQVDFWSTYKRDNIEIELKGSMYSNIVELKKVIKDETK